MSEGSPNPNPPGTNPPSADAAGTGSAPPDTPLARELREAAGGALAGQLSAKFLEEHCLLPLEIGEDGWVVVATGNAVDDTLIDELGWTFGRNVRLVEAPAAEIQAAIMSAGGLASSGAGEGTPGTDLEVLSADDEAFDDVGALANEPPVIKLVNVMILEALRARASDLHLESTEDGLRVRHRIDGVLHDVSRPPQMYQQAVMSRIKIMAELNIAERRLPQDGRIRLRLADREVDLRVSTVPSLHGESVVLRILDRGTRVRELDELGMSEGVLERFERVIRRPHGLVLVTGPTGSGKTTTLYAALRLINSPDVKILTVEDPVEYQLEGVTQIPVNRKAGLGFANVLRSILRHDPDIIMIGEMRDAETAEIAIQSALTGHLVFSTLHTNDAPGGLTRLVDMGVEPYLASATVEAILAQRLVRRVCEECAQPYEPSPEEIAQLEASGEDGKGYSRGAGCEACSDTGYRGRSGIYELMPLSDGIRELVTRQARIEEIRALALREGMVTLRRDGWEKARTGHTTVEEVLRVTADEVVE